MKKIVSLFAVIMSTAIISGCGSKPVSDKVNTSPVNIEKDSEKKKEIPEGLTNNEIEFSEARENELPANMANSIKLLMPNRGYFYEEKNNTYYIAIFLGKRSTGGYSIKVKSVEDIEGITNITVEEYGPKTNEMVTQVITYPYTIIKASQITPNFVVKNTKEESFEEMKKEWQEY